eukprot:g5770.t1
MSNNTNRDAKPAWTKTERGQAIEDTGHILSIVCQCWNEFRIVYESPAEAEKTAEVFGEGMLNDFHIRVELLN